jgi:hypothetical protein
VQLNYNLARALVLTGDTDAALARLASALETAEVVRDRLRRWIGSDAVLAPLMSDPRMRAMLEETGEGGSGRGVTRSR